MPTVTDILTARVAEPALTLTLRHASPFWDLTLQNTGTVPIWIDYRERIPAGDSITISRRARRIPAFRLLVGNYAVRITPPATPLDLPTVTVQDDTFSFARPVHRSTLLPLEATASPTTITLTNTSTDATLYIGPDSFYPGDILFIDPRDLPLNIGAPDGAIYEVTVSVIKGLSVTLVIPAPPPPPPAETEVDPDFNAVGFFPHVLQQLYFRDVALLMDILQTQGFTPGQVAAFLIAVAKI